MGELVGVLGPVGLTGVEADLVLSALPSFEKRDRAMPSPADCHGGLLEVSDMNEQLVSGRSADRENVRPGGIEALRVDLNRNRLPRIGVGRESEQTTYQAGQQEGT